MVCGGAILPRSVFWKRPDATCRGQTHEPSRLHCSRRELPTRHERAGDHAVKITAIEPFTCDGGLREFGFVKVSTDEGIVGWAETYDWHTAASLAAALQV